MARVGGNGHGAREEYWRGKIKSCELSGMSIVRYCREQGLSVSKYHWWKAALKRRDAERVVAPGFAEVRAVHAVESAASAVPGRPCGAPSLIELSLAGDRRIGVRPGFDADTLARVIAVVEGLGC